jgi:putative aldouronate transport system substrate-binding protein
MKKPIWAVLIIMLAGLMLVSACSTGNKGNRSQDSGPTDRQDNNSNKTAEANFNATGYPIVNEPITLKMFGPKNVFHVDWDQMDFFKYMEEKTNIHFEFDTPPVGDAFIEKKNLLVASGEYPDIFFGAGLTTADEVNYGSQGVIIPLNDLIEKYAPNLASVLEDPVIRGSITTTDGNIYALPQLTETYLNYPKIWFNKKWLDTLGLAEPKTIDELYDVLVAIKNGDPNGNGIADEIPITDYSGINGLKQVLLTAFGLLDGTSGREVGVENDRAFFVPTDERYKAFLEFMHKLYAEELLDPESYSQTFQQWTAKGNEDRYGFFNFAGAFLVIGTERNFDYLALRPLTSAWNDKPLQLMTPTIIRGTFAISSSNPYPEASIRWVDQLYSLEGAVLISEGIEGVHWVEAEGGGIQHLRPDDIEQETWRGMISPAVGVTVPMDFREHFARTAEFEVKTHPLNYHITSETNAKLKPFAQMGFPLVYFTNEEQQQLNVLSADIRTYVEQMEAKFITGEIQLNEWDNYVRTLEKMNVDEFVKIHQQAYDRWRLAQ